MKLLLLVLVVVLLVPDAADARRGQRVLVVRDYTSAAWGGVIEQTVEDFNAVMPKRGPHLVYRRADGPCPASVKRPTVAVCEFWHVTVWGAVQGGAVRERRIEVSGDPMVLPHGHRARALCHEMMHAITGIRDNHVYDPATGITTWALPDQSCVWGELSQPGPFDLDRLRQVYQRKR
jgi:hypothetical protein